MWLGTFHAELGTGQQTDQTLGATVVFALVVLWVGRSQWALVIRQMFRGARC
jgi:hypothetical protein